MRMRELPITTLLQRSFETVLTLKTRLRRNCDESKQQNCIVYIITIKNVYYLKY